MENKFKKGDSVVLVSDVYWGDDRFEGFEPMTVLDLTADGDVVVEVNGWYDKKEKEIYTAADLMLEHEAEEKMSQLDKEFQTLSPEISKKMATVGAVFNEALAMAKNNGFKLSDFVPVYQMKSMIREGGWSGSSFSC